MTNLFKQVDTQEQAEQETLLDWFTRQAKGVTLSRLQGATFGFSDEVLGAEAALVSYLGDDYDDDMGFVDRYKSERDALRAELEQYRSSNPIMSAGNEFIAAMGTGGVGLNAAKGLVARVGVGAGEGAAAAAGAADEFQDIPGELAEGAAIGAGTTLALPPVMRAAGKIAEPVANTVGAVTRYLSEKPEQAAIRQLRPLIYEEELLEMGPLGMVADTSEQARRLLRGLHAQNPQASDELERVLALRQEGTVERLAEPLVTDNELTALQNQIKRSRSRIAKSNYTEAYKASVPITGDFAKTMNTSDMRNAYRRAVTIAQRLGEDLPSYNEVYQDDKIKELPLMAVDYMKRAIDSKITRASRQGGDDYRSLLALKERLTDYTDEISPEYAKARQMYTTDARLLDALTTGRSLYKLPASELEEQLRSMSNPERNMFRRGAQNAVLERLRTGKRMGNPELRLVDTPERMDQMRLAFETDDEFQDFLKNVEVEGNFTKTQQTIRGGSPTQRIAHDTDALEGGLSVAMGGYGEIARQLINNVRGTAQGKQAEELIRLLSRQNWSKEEIDDLLLGQKDIPPWLPESMHNGVRRLRHLTTQVTPYHIVGGLQPVLQQ